MINNKNKIALGTVQFGLDYGINNKRGKIPPQEVFEILNEASKCKIDTIDTAHSYGESETLIGDFIYKYKKDFKIISKLPKCNILELENNFYSSLNKLDIEKFYGYLIHNFSHYLDNPYNWNIRLEMFKLKGKIDKIGFSLYFPSELDYILKKNIKIDMIQVPYSIFDQRFNQYFSELKERSIEIHVRSVFLQGLVFTNPDNLGNHFVKLKEKIIKLNQISNRLNVPLVALCLNFAVLNRFIDKVVVGVDSLNNLIEIISSARYISDVSNIITELSNFKEDDEKIILPINWK